MPSKAEVRAMRARAEREKREKRKEQKAISSLYRPRAHWSYIPIRICSPHKTDVTKGWLHELYNAPMLRSFFGAFNKYAILSRKLGICFSWIIHENYGDHEEKSTNELLSLLRVQAADPRYSKYKYVYWNHRPLTHDKWVNLLREAGFVVEERRTLDEIKAMFHEDILSFYPSYTS